MWPLSPLFLVIPALGEKHFVACTGDQCAGQVLEMKTADLVKVSAGEEPWVVMFYANWCGACAAYAPTFKSVAASFAGEHDKVKFGGYDCVTEDHCGLYIGRFIPLIKIFSEANSTGTAVDDNIWINEDLLTQSISNQLAVIAKRNSRSSTPAPDRLERSWDPKYLSATKSDHWWDAHIAVFSCMKTSLFLNAPSGKVSDEVSQGAKKYLGYIVEHFPEKSLATQLGELQNFLGNATLDNEIKWRADIETRFSHSTRHMTYKSCKDFNCGQWNLFHTLAEQVNNEDVSSRELFYEVVKIFPKYFFGCRECQTHFQEMLDRTEDGRKNMPANIWFWKAHNEVTTRVYNGTRPSWPPAELCRTCWHADGKANKKEVEEFLKRDYGADNHPANTQKLETWQWTLIIVGVSIVVAAVVIVFSVCAWNKHKKQRSEREKSAKEEAAPPELSSIPF